MTKTEDNVSNFNRYRLRQAVEQLEKDEDILKFARWVNQHVTEEFTVEPPKRDLIREILMTLPDKNGYYSPPYS
jgi:hypothetical protein